jgi:WD domain, G-beta repeat/KAP family P-loop domain
MAKSSGEKVPFAGHAGPVFGVAYSPDGATLTTTGDRTARMWDARSGEPLRTLTGHTDWVLAVAYSPDGATLTTTGDRTIRVWNSRTGRQVAGTGFGVVTRPMRPLAGVRSDQPSEEDLLGFREDVETLAALVTAAATEPPLAIALLGDWGSGKSSVMRQMRRQVQYLADLSVSNLGLSSFAATVRQVSFNAWHYSDDRLWAGLIEHLFRELASPTGAEPTVHDPTDAREQRRRMHDDLADLRAQDEHLTIRLTAFGSAQPRGIFSRLGSPSASARLLLTGARELVRDIRTYGWLLVAWALFGVGASLRACW